MDMKKILQAYDSASQSRPVEGSNDMKKFMQIVEGQGPLDRTSQAQSSAMQTPATKHTVASSARDVDENVKSSMIGKNFKSVYNKLLETKRQSANPITERVTPNPDGSYPDPKVNRLTGQPNPPAPEPAPTNIKPSGATVVFGGTTYNVMGTFGDGIRPRIGPSDKVIPAKAYVKGDKMYVFLDNNVQEDNLNEKCWPTHKQIGMKKKGGRMVPNCVPKENINVDESGLQYHTGVKKHGEKYMRLAADAARKGASQQELGRLRDKHSKAYKNKEGK